MYGLQDWAAVQRVYKQTNSKRETARILKISRNTVKKLLELKEEPTYKRTVYKSCLDEYKELIIEWRCEPYEYNGTRIFEELKKKGYTRSIGPVYRFLQRVDEDVGLISSKATVRIETPPGDQAQFDWSEYEVVVAGRYQKVYCFAMILSASRKKAVCISRKADANATAIEAINNADTGILKTAQTYADTKVQELADGQVATNKSDIAKLNGDASTDGSVAKAVKDSADAINAKIGTLADLDTTAKTDLVNAINEVRAAVDVGGTGSQVTIDSSVAEEGMVKSYVFKQGETTIGTVNVPLDLVVSGGEIVVDPDGQTAGTYLKLTIANQASPIYINVADLVDAYTAQANGTQIQLAISDTNEISATIVAGSIGTTELGANAVTTAKIADGNVTLAKLGADVTPTLTQVETNKTDIADLKTKVGDGMAAISEDEINALFSV